MSKGKATGGEQGGIVALQPESLDSGGNPKSAGPLTGGGGALAARQNTPVIPLPARKGPLRLQDHRIPSAKNAGKDPKTGAIIPHKRSEKIAAIVSQYIASGASQNEIAVLLNIRPGQLRECYAVELEFGTVKANMEVAQTVFKQAKTKGNMRASEFWLKSRAGWRDGEQKQVDADSLNIHIHL